jgi:hypothetical protein
MRNVENPYHTIHPRYHLTINDFRKIFMAIYSDFANLPLNSIISSLPNVRVIRISLLSITSYICVTSVSVQIVLDLFPI